MTFHPVSACRSCGSEALTPVLDLGEQPLANALRVPSDHADEATYPLSLVHCGGCGLVQLSGTVPPSVMFDEYPYFSSYSTTMVAAMRDLARALVVDRDLGERDLVVEVASNDGYLLRHYRDAHVPVLGVEPAANVAKVAEASGIPTIVAYFGQSIADRIVDEHGHAAIIHANNVMAHVPDINDFVAGLSTLVAPDGIVVIETPHVVQMVARTEFDTVYHEHVFYYSLLAVEALFSRHGLTVLDVEELPIHGGSLRIVAGRGGEASDEVLDLRRRESEVGVGRPAFYLDLDARVGALRERVTAALHERNDRGERIFAYGAAAKGAVLMNHFGLGPEVIEMVVDRNVHKQGYLMPGTHQPIGDPELLLAERPDAVLLLTWNFEREIVEQQRAYLEAGGLFLVPIPDLREVRS